MKSILDPSFRYVSSANTDIRKTFARVRSELRKRAEAQAADEQPKVTPLSPEIRAAIRIGRG